MDVEKREFPMEKSRSFERAPGQSQNTIQSDTSFANTVRPLLQRRTLIRERKILVGVY
jgi:hypothetical protein